MRSLLLLLAVATAATAAPPTRAPYLCAPALTDYARHDPEGTTILPSGRLLRPVGRHLPLPRWPHGLTLSPDGSELFIACDKVGRLVSAWQGEEAALTEVFPTVGTTDKRSNGGAAVYSPDGRTLYWSSGDTGAVYVFEVATRTKLAEVSLNATLGATTFRDSYAMDLKLSGDGRYLYCADVTNFRVAVVDTAARKLVGSVRVGRYPYALTSVGDRVCVANIGMFEYSPIPAPESDQYDKRGLTFPAFGVPSREAEQGVEVEGRRVPGLGDPNVPESFSVWVLDTTEPAQPRVTARIKTGLLVGAPADNGKTVGGSAPNFVLARGNSLFVSNGNNDTVERIDLPSARIVRKVRLQPSPLTARLRGVGPAGMALSPDGSRLYVAESGINALAVLEPTTLEVLGHIPTAWYPYRVAVSADGRHLAVICFKGFGNGPSAGADRPSDPFMSMRGVLTTLPVPPEQELRRLTQTVLTCNGMRDRSRRRAELTCSVLPTTPGVQSEQIKYVVFITKENHTYDAIFDRVPGANDDPSLLRWGYHQKLSAEGQPTLEDVAVMTNHNALARQFTVSDNFYMEPEFSGVGHRWLVGVQPNNFCQMTYTLGWGFSATSSAPGRHASFGSSGSIAPEDYPEAGAMWEHLAHYGVPFRNYGEGFEFAGVQEGENEWKTGAREVVNIPMSKVLFDNTCREFPIFNMNIPDQYRVDWFVKDVQERFLSGRYRFPRFLNIAICNDHGTRPNPKRGYPYVASWMADNDLALGRLVEFLSHTPYWKNMLILVTEDDSGGEPDHIDAQRSVLLVISPWAKRGYVSHRHTTIPSMHRTLYEILGLPALNMFDGLANDFADCFTTTPDERPYEHVAVDPRVFDPEKAKDPNDPDYKQARLLPSVALDDPEMVDELSAAPGSATEDD